MGDHAEPGENEDVDFWVSEEPEQVLIEDRVAASGGVKERGV